MNHANVLVLFRKSPHVCKSDRMVSSEHHGDTVDIEYFFYLVCHPSVRLDYVSGGNNNIAIVNRAENAEWVDACLDVKVLIGRRRHGRSGTNGSWPVARAGANS